MKIIKDTKLFHRLKCIHELDKSGDISRVLWKALFNPLGDILNDEIPVFYGGLDHIDVMSNQIVFHDIGVNDRNNSFIIRKDSKNDGNLLNDNVPDCIYCFNEYGSVLLSDGYDIQLMLYPEETKISMEYEDDSQMSVGIAYCPFCGRKL